MKNCKKCNGIIPKKIKIKAKEYNIKNRIYCFKCSPFRERFKIYDKLDHTCEICKRKYKYDKKLGHSFKKCNSCMVSVRRKANKLKSIKLLGGKCEKCEYNKCINALEMHHKNPKNKNFTIGSSYNKSWNVIKKEVLKCRLLCANCHREEHDRSQ